jgi:hypothetical protein
MLQIWVGAATACRAVAMACFGVISYSLSAMSISDNRFAMLILVDVLVHEGVAAD